MRHRLGRVLPPFHLYAVPQIATDAALALAAYYLAFQLRFDQGIPDRYQELFEATLPPFLIGCVVVFVLSGLYHKWWRYSGRRDYGRIVQAGVISVVLLVVYVSVFHPVKVGVREVVVGLPAGVVAVTLLLMISLMVMVRAGVHLIFERRPHLGLRSRANTRDVIIVGAGDGGRLVLRELLRNPELGLQPVGFVDDDPSKRGMRVEGGARVLGRTSDIGRVLDETDPDEVLIAIPSAPGSLRALVVAACRKRGIPVRTMPTVFELLQTGTNVARQIREVRVEDVLGREPVRMELDSVGAYLRGQVVVVTGAGGSIGSELSRQIARVGPRRLVLIDHAEDNLFNIHRELTEDRHFHSAVPVVADCKEERRIREILEQHRPTAVFHAAAHKHVAMMECNPSEAIRNNSFATRLIARLCGDAGVKHFVLVSTDKAVEPENVMGASKALAELAVEQAALSYPETGYSSVRFGNVLGSSGSVVPIFRRQIAAGGPVTVTDPKMTRYFMTIPEAVQLIIRAGSLGDKGEIFVLEMGDPVPIIELARDMIALSGLEPDRDIAIEVVGRRPGEKLHEQLFNPYEHPQTTNVEKIQLAKRDAIEPLALEGVFLELDELVRGGDEQRLADRTTAVLPELRTQTRDQGTRSSL